jgi:aryl-alcohol dehydrogenase-like predicted oxidoreductase
MSEQTRREFLQRAAAGAAVLGLGDKAADKKAAPPAATTLPRRKLGKTGVEVSMLGFGGGSRWLRASEEEAGAMIDKAVASGMNYFDTAASYGTDRDSEKRYGRLLAKYRDKIFLATKTDDRTYDGASRSVEESLKALKSDHLDLIQIHSAVPKDDPAAWEKPGGVLTALRKLRDQKVVRFVGFTGHTDAEVHRHIIESLEFDTVLMALNAAQHKPFRERALPAAVAKNMGIIAMKTVRGVIGDGPAKASPRELLAYVWDLPVATLITGMETLAQLDENVRLACDHRAGAVNTAALTARLQPVVTAEQLGWAMPGYVDA